MYFKEECAYIASQQLIAENWPILPDDEIIYIVCTITIMLQIGHQLKHVLAAVEHNTIFQL